MSSFLDGGMDEEEFVKCVARLVFKVIWSKPLTCVSPSRQYKEIRKVYHRRAVNLEKWEAGSVVGWGRL